MRTLAVSILLLILVGFAIGEQFWVKDVYGKMGNETASLIQTVEATPDTVNKEDFKFDDYLKIKIDELHDYWIKKEKNLSIIIRYIDLSYISDALIYAQNFMHADNKEETLAGLKRLKYLVDSYSAIYGFNGINIL